MYSPGGKFNALALTLSFLKKLKKYKIVLIFLTQHLIFIVVWLDY
jgi:hypothetical protein